MRVLARPTRGRRSRVSSRTSLSFSHSASRSVFRRKNASTALPSNWRFVFLEIMKWYVQDALSVFTRGTRSSTIGLKLINQALPSRADLPFSEFDSTKFSSLIYYLVIFYFFFFFFAETGATREDVIDNTFRGVVRRFFRDVSCRERSYVCALSISVGER